jgi:hypothetical protein
VAAYVPPGWPVGVHPPGSERFEQTAVTWLLDVVPPDYRVHGVLLRHPAALAALARHHLAACVQGAREGYRAARSELSAQLPPRGVEAVLAAYCAEGGRLVKTAQAADLVGRALRGEVFTPPSASPFGPSGSRVSSAPAGTALQSGEPSAQAGTAAESGSPGSGVSARGTVPSRAASASLSRGRSSPRRQAHPPAPAAPSGTTPPSQPARRSRPRTTRARPAAEARAR